MTARAIWTTSVGAVVLLMGTSGVALAQPGSDNGRHEGRGCSSGARTLSQYGDLANAALTLYTYRAGRRVKLVVIR